jgi:hypothetical protein
MPAWRIFVLSTGLLILISAAPPPIPPISERVTFPSADGTTMLVGYLFRPQGEHPAKVPRCGHDARPSRGLLHRCRRRI